MMLAFYCLGGISPKQWMLILKQYQVIVKNKLLQFL